ncbi:hypothetical protein [Agromyces sp. ZXT2-6]|uniref:hypothetical protein n=1 Tax=Agromyces sp. ZXT2-6 TaxID=3461153 RepID=UPI004055102C
MQLLRTAAAPLTVAATFALAGCTAAAADTPAPESSAASISQTCSDLAFPLTIAWNAIATPEGEVGVTTRDGMVRSAKKELTAIAETTEPGSHLRVVVEATATAAGALSPGDSATHDAFTDSVRAVVELCESNGEPLELTGWYGG